METLPVVVVHTVPDGRAVLPSDGGSPWEVPGESLGSPCGSPSSKAILMGGGASVGEMACGSSSLEGLVWWGLP